MPSLLPYAVKTVLATPWLRPLNDVDALDDLLVHIAPTWALGRIRARVVRVVDETPDTKTFVLRPNRNWPGARAGQHVGVIVEVRGIRHERRYSLSSVPRAGGRPTITVKRQPGGIVSNWLHDHVRVGDVLTLAAPQGDFVLPDPLPPRMLMLAAGSGITPLMAMLRALVRPAARTDVVVVQVASRPTDAIFGTELAALAATVPGLAWRPHFTAADGRFDLAALSRLVPDSSQRHTLLCGPAGFMQMIRDDWQARGLAGRLQLEAFGVPPPPTTADDDVHQIHCARAEVTFDAGPDALLVAAERAGLQPRYGCRMGICRSCLCVKQSGRVENLLTGQISTEPGDRIQLCISRARSAVTLDL